MLKNQTNLKPAPTAKTPPVYTNKEAGGIKRKHRLRAIPATVKKLAVMLNVKQEISNILFL
jgi:hypothetical protein